MFTVQVQLTQEEWRTLKRVARIRRISTSEMVRELMKLPPLDALRPELDLPERAGGAAEPLHLSVVGENAVRRNTRR